MSKVRVCSFVAQIQHGASADSSYVLEKYNLPERFIFLPNQFWKHKNHKVVVEALAIAAQEDSQLLVVCSGATVDYRDEKYFPTLEERIKVLGIEKNIRILGLIPEVDVSALMYQCIFVLQPSLYEGWSTVVEEAKSLGKPIVLSSLPVHIEQAPKQATYFDPHNPEDLAAALVAQFPLFKPGIDLAGQEAAARDRGERTQAFGNRFLSIAGEITRNTQ
jgi:glycosyltransferase involved in cell wall biosynthesis